MKFRLLCFFGVLCIFFLDAFNVLNTEEKPKENGAASAVEFKKILPKIDLKDGETLIFLGDSITYQCLYTQYVETYFYTRYPDRRIHFRNAGVGGDRAKHSLARFEDDVASFDPDYVTVLLGMNDASYDRFEFEHFADYQRDMNTIMGLIEESGAKGILLHPTMFDARASRIQGRTWEPVATYYNGVLALYGAWLREVATRRGLGFVDMYSPMNNLTADQRKVDPTFTMIPDSVHPAPTGQVVMAVAMLDDLFVRSSLNSISINSRPGGERVLAAVNGEVTDIVDEGPEGKIQFNFMAKALPWVLPPEAAEGYKLTKAGHRYSGERFAARGLKPGRYKLQIDGQVVGQYESNRLARGIELQENKKTPQYQQAQKVALLNQKRNQEAVKALREWWLNLRRQERDLGKIIDAFGEDSKAAKEKAEEKRIFEKEKFPRGIAETTATAKTMEDEIYRINQPIKRQYELIPIRGKK